MGKVVKMKKISKVEAWLKEEDRKHDVDREAIKELVYLQTLYNIRWKNIVHVLNDYIEQNDLKMDAEKYEVLQNVGWNQTK